MKIYHYRPENGEYLGEGLADKDPMVEGNWLIPANATKVEHPEFSEGEIPVFVDGKWFISVDNRGVEYWLSDRSKHKITELGVSIPEYALFEDPTPVVDTYAIDEHAWVKSELTLVDKELMYYWTGDTKRASYSEQGWKDYAIALRNYTTLVDNIPVVNSGVRPISPYNVG